MKLNQATVVAFLSATLATSAAGSEHEEMKAKIASLLVAPKIHRMLEGLSAECSADTGAFAIEISTDVAYAMAACPQGIVLSGNTATIDWSVCDPQFTESVTTACTAVNGIIVSGIGDVRMNCNVKGQSITVVSKEVPECLANSCDVSNWEAEKANLLNSGEFEAAFSAALGGSCSMAPIVNEPDATTEGDDPFLMVSEECQSESLETEEEFEASNGSYSCEDAGGKLFKLEFEGTCPFSGEGFSTEYGTQSGDSNCVGTSCTVEEFQASFDAMVTSDNSSYEGCSNFKVSSLDDSQDDTLVKWDDFMTDECVSESIDAREELEAELGAGNASYSSCKDASGKVFKVEFEGTCPASIEYNETSGDSICVGTSCTVKEYQAYYDAFVSQGPPSYYEGCSTYQWASSGAFSLGTAGCVMAGLLLSTVALFN